MFANSRVLRGINSNIFLKGNRNQEFRSSDNTAPQNSRAVNLLRPKINLLRPQNEEITLPFSIKIGDFADITSFEIGDFADIYLVVSIDFAIFVAYKIGDFAI